jgi:hypothetical protein
VRRPPRPPRCAPAGAAEIPWTSNTVRGGGAYDALGRFVERDRDRPFKATWPRDEHPDAARERARGDPGFVRPSVALSGGGNGRLDALPAGGGDSLAGGCGQGHGVRIAGHAGGRKTRLYRTEARLARQVDNACWNAGFARRSRSVYLLLKCLGELRWRRPHVGPWRRPVLEPHYQPLLYGRRVPPIFPAKKFPWPSANLRRTARIAQRYHGGLIVAGER